MPPAPPFTLPDNVLPALTVKVSFPVPPVKLPKLLKVKVAVASFNVPLLFPVILHAFTVFSPIKVFAPLPPFKVLKLLNVKVAVPSLAVPLNPCAALEPVKVAVFAALSSVSALATAAPAAASSRVMLENVPTIGFGEPDVAPLNPFEVELESETSVSVA